MKKITMLFLFLLSAMLSYGQEVTIGVGTINQTHPLSNYFGYQRSAALYTAAEIGQGGFITQLAWNVGRTGANRPIKIYLKEVDAATLTSATWATLINDALPVYSGVFEATTTGYRTITLDRSFHYSGGTKNLVVLVEANFGGSGTDSINGLEIKASSATNLHLGATRDSSAPDGMLSFLSNRPNIKITFGTETPGCLGAVPIVSTVGATSMELDVIGVNSTALSVQYEVRTAEAAGSGATGLVTSGTVTDLTTFPIEISDLTDNTNYSVYVKVVCDEDTASDFSEARTFTTREIGVIGEGTRTETSFPLYSYNSYNYAQMIYTADEVEGVLGANKLIERIRLYYTGNGTTSNYDRWTLYMLNTSVGEFTGTSATNWIDPSLFSQVFQGTVTLVRNAWVEIELDSPFVWNEGSNLAIALYENAPGWSSGASFGVYGTTNYRGINRNTDTEFSPNTGLGSPSGRYQYLPKIYLGGIVPPSCYFPLNTAVSNIEAESAQLNWDIIDEGESNGIDYYISTTDTAPTDTTTPSGSSLTGDDRSLDLEDLTESTTYYVWTRNICEDDSTTAWISRPVVFTTALIPATLPFTDNFEQEGNYGFANHSLNKWHIGTAVNNGGTSSLYISNDDGVTNQYSTSTTQVSHIYKDFTIPADAEEIEVQFDWRSVGDGSDGFSVWVVPVNFMPVAGSEITISADRVRLGRTMYNLNQAFITERMVVNASDFAGQMVRLVFQWKNNDWAGTQPPAAIDNLKLLYSACVQPTNLAVDTLSSTSIDVEWTAVEGVSNYEVIITTTPTAPADTAVGTTVSTTSHTFDNLASNTTYYIWVRSICSSTNKSLWSNLRETTPLVPVSLPYVDDFETDQEYGIVNHNLNKWFIGNAVNNGGERALYISNDEGVSNIYTNNQIAQYSYIFKDFTIPTGATDIEITFDWRCVGENSWDVFRVWMVPTTHIPTAGTAITATNSGGVQVGRSVYSLNPSFEAERIVADASTYAGQTMRLVFEWKNDTSGGTQPPAAIDNLKLKQITCPTVDPTTITIGSITRNSAVVSWTAVAGISSYDVYHNTTGIRPDETTTPTATVNGTTHTLNNLEDGTQFFVWVRSHCSATDTGYWEGPIVFGTDLGPVNLPYYEDFNENPKFGYVNDSKNKWFVGQADNIIGEAMYISKDNGVSNSYDVNGVQVSHIYKDIVFPANATEVYTMSFKWRSEGEGTAPYAYDYFKVWLVPTTYVPVAGVQTTAANSGGVQLGQDIYNLTASFTPERIDFDATPYAGQTMRVIFEWRQNGYSGAQPPAAIKNFYIQHVTCGDIEEIVIEKIDNTEDFHISWTPAGDETKWEVFIHEVGERDPLYATQGIVVEGTPEYIFEDAVEEVFYRVYVRAICSDTEKGFWVGPQEFSIFYPPGCANINVEELDIEIADDGNYYLCTDEPVTLDLKANFYDIRATTEYEVESIDYDPPFPFVGGDAISLTRDDYWSDIIDLGFDFCFFGNSYDKVLIGTNGMLTFSIAGEVENGRYRPLGTTGYSFDDTHQIPIDRGGSPPYVNSIFGVMQDMYPNNSPSDYSVNYQILGTAPCRALVFNMYHMGLFGSNCPYNPSDIEGSTQTTQVVLYEGTNIIEVYVKNRKACTGFNNGSGLIGIQNEDGTQGYAPPGRNSGPWDAQNEAWRFVPSGPSIATFQWLKDGVFYSDQTDISVTIEESVVYTGKISYTHCNGEELEIKKNFSFLKEPFELSTPTTLYDCAKKPGSEYFYNLDEIIPSVLQGLNIEEFTIEYFTSKADLDAGINPIDPSFVTKTPEDEIIYMKVTNKLTKCPKDTSFRLGKNEQLGATQIEPIFICKEVVLPKLADGEAYYTDPYGAGTKYEAGALYNVVGMNTLYVYREDENGCYGQSEFTIEILPEVFSPVFEDQVFSCEAYKLPPLPAGSKYYTLPNEGGIELPVDYEVIVPMTIYIVTRNGNKEVYCYDETSFTVDFEECPIPKGFSPNGDGINDTFDLSNHGVAKLQIFNRNGVEVYSHGLGYKTQWAGQNNSGKLLPAGTYYYVVVTHGNMRTGWVQLNY
ncbi:fibronectin type III domain-containing protein [Myroides sp. C8-3]|uniref:gliding motility-associated C-terminal domain-containing protein n=1 Tax=Myroides sp. C8-3 TaxID=3400533 RepID=UPI003D2F59BB